ncbi:hypothetical protein RB195_004006 [Necator americanus]|uniref:Uncharacterized protein n=1 Tax=Necator americanus TaxID=51031 RepID=A0ABR1DR85_NECAM
MAGLLSLGKTLLAPPARVLSQYPAHWDPPFPAHLFDSTVLPVLCYAAETSILLIMWLGHLCFVFEMYSAGSRRWDTAARSRNYPQIPREMPSEV